MSRARSYLARTVLLGLACAGAGVAPAVFGAVEFEPEISIGIARTDNVSLAPENPESETIYQLIPAFDMTQEATRLSSDVAYRLEGYYYDNRSDSDVYHQLDSAARAELDPDHFFLDFGASRSQSIRDPTEPIPRSNLPISSNRIDRDELYAGPALEYVLGRDTIVRSELRRTWIRYGEALELGGTAVSRRDYDEDTFSFSVDNYRRARGFSWAVRYDAEKADYGVFQPWEYRQASVELGGWVGEALRIFATGGKESAWDQPFDSSLEDTFWEAGFSRTVRDRFTAEFAVGERTFGSSRRGELEITWPRASVGLSYTEQPTTEGRNPYERGGLLNPEIFDDFLTRPGSAERYISKRFGWNLGLSFGRTDFSASLFDESREQRTRIDGSPLPDEEQKGLYLSASRRLGVRTSLGFSAQRVRRQFSVGDERDLTSVSITAGYELGARTQLSFSYEYTDEESRTGVLGADYTARFVSLLLTRSF